MANIFGTIINIGDFLKKADARITILRGYEAEEVFLLNRDRRYVVPDYQREIRWLKEHLIELISDISRGTKFLGNIILNKRSNTEYEIIDGQQRITVLLMIIYYIKSKYQQELNIFETCELAMANFGRFDLLVRCDFDINRLSPEETTIIEASDVFNQRIRYSELWNELNGVDIFQTASRCNDLLANIKRSQINLIVNINDTQNLSIDYFLDVNLKGVKLDKEDIFKGYLFSQDPSQGIRDEWKNFKILAFRLNDKTEYPTTKLLEHYLYCDLYKHAAYRNIQFREDFTITEVELNGIKHYTGEHIVRVIQNNSYMLQGLRNINKFITIIIDILNNDAPSQSFKDLFNPSTRPDSTELIIIHNFIKKIMSDRNVVPRILIMKYIIEILFERSQKTKNDYRKIYGIYLLAVLFTVFEGEKDIKKVLGVVKDPDWYAKTVEQSKSYFSRSKISKSRITAQYKLINANDTENHRFRCKSLATIYNFFEIRNNTVKVISGGTNNLKMFVSDSDRFSYEHFIINDRGVYSFIDDANSYSYPPDIKKYANSIFNFIFTSRQLNQELGNHTLPEKINIINEKLANNPTCIECEFSKMIIEMCTTHFAQLLRLSTENIEGAAIAMNSFYQNEFVEVFSNYAMEVIKKIGDKMGVA